MCVCVTAFELQQLFTQAMYGCAPPPGGYPGAPPPGIPEPIYARFSAHPHLGAYPGAPGGYPGGPPGNISVNNYRP